MTANMISMIYAYTAIGVCIIIGAAGLGSAIGWGLICSKTIEGITRQPEMKPVLMTNMFVFAGLMESFPFIILAFAMWFLFSNPFVGAMGVAIKALG